MNSTGLIGRVTGAATPSAGQCMTEMDATPNRVPQEVIDQKMREQRNWDLRHKFEILCQAQAIRDDTKLMDEIREWVRAEKNKIARQLDALGM